MSSSTPTDFGHDLACVNDLDPTMREVEGGRLVQEVIARRCITAPDMNIDAPGEGIDVRESLGDDVTESDMLQLRADVLRESTADPRAPIATVNMTLDQVDGDTRATIDVNPEGAAGPFSLVVTPDKLTLEILRGGT